MGSNPTPSASTNPLASQVRAHVRPVSRGVVLSGCVRPVPTGYGCPSPMPPQVAAGSGDGGVPRVCDDHSMPRLSQTRGPSWRDDAASKSFVVKVTASARS